MGGTLSCSLEVALLISNHWAGAQAVSVPSHQPGELVLKLRHRIVVDERELQRRTQRCSSLEQGPFCMKLGHPGLGVSGLVDGMLSQQLRENHPEAFHWDQRDRSTTLTINHLLDRLGGEEDEIQKRPQRPQRPRCFELQLWRLPPSFSFLPESFGEGFPVDAAPRWQGVWQVAQCPLPSSPATMLFFGEAHPGRGPCLRVHGLGPKRRAAVKFGRPLVLHRVVVGIPDSVARLESWDRGSFVCGMNKGFERWCRDIAHIAEDAKASKTHGAGDGTFYRDVGDSFQMIDEVIFHQVSPEGLLIGGLAASMAPEKNNTTQVVMLLHRKFEQGDKLPVAPPEPFLANVVSISTNAVVWTADEILANGLGLSGYTSGVEHLRSRAKFLAEEASKWREDTNRKRDFFELDWKRKHGIVRDEKETETIEEKPAELTEEEEILSSETDEQELLEPLEPLEPLESLEPPEPETSEFDASLQEQLVDALSELLQTFGVEGAEESQRSSPVKFETVQVGNAQVVMAKVMADVQVETKVQELLEEMTSSLLDQLKQADGAESTDFPLAQGAQGKDGSEEPSWIRDP